MFYPTDNSYKNDQLGYYRQREWRLIVTNINLKGRPIGRKLSESEVAELEQIDPEFWSRKLSVDGVEQPRSELALSMTRHRVGTSSIWSRKLQFRQTPLTGPEPLLAIESAFVQKADAKLTEYSLSESNRLRNIRMIGNYSRGNLLLRSVTQQLVCRAMKLG